MKNLIKLFLSVVNTLWINLSQKKGAATNKSRFYLVKTSIHPQNPISIKYSKVEKTLINISGKGNAMECLNALVSDTSITIVGNNNKLVLADNVKLRKATVIIRGNNCTIQIGKGTTFGEVRLVNVGSNNTISIGEGCLFSDRIEVWASDTHPILNENDEVINPERPIHIGDKVWVGSNVTILKGVTIHNGSIIGMGSVVTKDVPANVVSAGYPSKTIKENIKWKLE